MAWVVMALLLAAVVFVAAGIKSIESSTVWQADGTPKKLRKWKLNGKQFLAILPLFLVIGGCVISIPAGHTGVLTTFGKVEDKVLTEGVNFKLPYQQVIKIDNRVQKKEMSFEAFSSDIQQTQIKVSLNFTVDKQQSQNLYRNVGISYFDTVIYPRVLENVKLIFSGYTAEELIEMRTVLSEQVTEKVQADMVAYGIEIVSVNIEDIDFTDTFTDAVEAKQVAQQNKLTTQTEQEAAIIVAEAEAQRRIIEAQADAETAKIAADAQAYAVKVAAEAEAEANDKVAMSLTDELIQYYQLTQWDGALPQVYGGEGSMFPVIDIPGNGQSTPDAE
ncbi:MAG: prohibitin family protein [Oscillospiraceae bacterium]|nr:prohibitin family protein [Oscillospiraceae bacterium]MBQ9938006.1 prohibitin family protein [Oscillospiraceae bacterium]